MIAPLPVSLRVTYLAEFLCISNYIIIVFYIAILVLYTFSKMVIYTLSTCVEFQGKSTHNGWKRFSENFNRWPILRTHCVAFVHYINKIKKNLEIFGSFQ